VSVGKLDGHGKPESVASLVLLHLPVECGPNVPASSLRLALDERRRPYRSAEQSVPELLGRRHVVTERDRVHLDTVQAAVLQQGSELILVSESEERWADRNVCRRCGARLGESVEEHPDQPRPHRVIPCGQGDPPAGAEHPDKLTHSLLWPRQVQDDEVPHDSIEGALLEGQRFGVRYPEVDTGVSFTGELNHRRGDIDPHHRRTPPSRLGSRIARPGRDVENPHAGAHAGGIQQRIDKLIRYATKEVIVCRGLTFPPGRLECVERGSVNRDAWLGGYRLVGRRHPISPPAGRRMQTTTARRSSFRAVSHPEFRRQPWIPLDHSPLANLCHPAKVPRSVGQWECRPGQGDPMKRLLVGGACVVAALIGGQGAGWAAPTNGHNTETLVVHCADNTVRVIIKPDGGASSWDVNAERELTGVRYFSTALAGRFYLGDLTTEPTDVDPIFVSATEWGNRTGHEGSVSCSGSETFTTDGQVFTGFFELTVTQQDKGN
jgi:hypothetical protein